MAKIYNKEQLIHKLMRYGFKLDQAVEFVNKLEESDWRDKKISGDKAWFSKCDLSNWGEGVIYISAHSKFIDDNSKNFNFLNECIAGLEISHYEISDNFDEVAKNQQRIETQVSI